MGSLTLAAIAVATVAVLAMGLRWGASSLGGPVALVVAFLAAQLVVRPLVLAVGLDEPYLQNPAYTGSLDSLAVKAALVGLAWVVVLVAPLALVRGLGSYESPPPRPQPATGRSGAALAVLLGLGLAGTCWYVWRLGGPLALTTARKGRGPATSSLPRACLLAAAVLGAAVLSAEHRAVGWAIVRRRPWLVAGTLAAVLGGLVWGARDVIVFPVVAAFAVRLAEVPATSSWVRVRRSLKPLLLAAVLLLVVAFGARLARDQAIDRAVDVAGPDSGPARQLMVATNLTSFDALMVVVSQWPDLADGPGLDEFRRQLPGPLGRQPTAGEPANFNVRVAQISVPGRLNGTPPTAAGDWWAAGGWATLVAGALLSGCLLTAAERWHARRRDERAITTTVAVIIVLGAASTGLTTNTAARMVGLLAPLLVVAAVSWLQRRPAAQPVAQPAGEQPPATPTRP